jgi:hypothetical protein
MDELLYLKFNLVINGLEKKISFVILFYPEPFTNGNYQLEKSGVGLVVLDQISEGFTFEKTFKVGQSVIKVVDSLVILENYGGLNYFE